MPTPDNKLVALAKVGDSGAFDELVALHQERVFALAYRMIGSREDAMDIQQETFIKAWQHLSKFRQDSEFTTWLHRIAVNLCLSRKRRYQPLMIEDFPEDDIRFSSLPCTISQIASSETVAAVRGALAKIPAHYRALIVLRDMEDRSFEEIAQILKCSVASARVRTCKARKILRDRLRPYIEENDR